MTEATTVSLKISDMTVEELVQVSQGIGHQIEKLRSDRAYLKRAIDAKLQQQHSDAIKAQVAALQAQLGAVAPGAVIDASSAAS